VGSTGVAGSHEFDPSRNIKDTEKFKFGGGAMRSKFVVNIGSTGDQVAGVITGLQAGVLLSTTTIDISQPSLSLAIAITVLAPNKEPRTRAARRIFLPRTFTVPPKSELPRFDNSDSAALVMLQQWSKRWIIASFLILIYSIGKVAQSYFFFL
jgi:hypothetical protein